MLIGALILKQLKTRCDLHLKNNLELQARRICLIALQNKCKDVVADWRYTNPNHPSSAHVELYSTGRLGGPFLFITLNNIR